MPARALEARWRAYTEAVTDALHAEALRVIELEIENEALQACMQRLKFSRASQAPGTSPILTDPHRTAK